MTNFINGEKPIISQAFELTPNTTKTGIRICTGCMARSATQWLLALSSLTSLEAAE